MSTTYAPRQTKTQKVADSKAASLFDSSSQSESLQRKANMANNAVQREEAMRPNNTGMPDNLKSGIESLSGFSMNDVRVHYNSSKPATVQALAYTQGTDIHVAPGQEKHLPHEAWHVAQQMAGRVSPTTNINGMPVNDNASLEHEADVMGEKAVQCKKSRREKFLHNRTLLSTESVQRISAIEIEGPREDIFNTLGELKRWINDLRDTKSFSKYRVGGISLDKKLQLIEEISRYEAKYDTVCLGKCIYLEDVARACQQANNQGIQFHDHFYNCDTIGDLKKLLDTSEPVLIGGVEFVQYLEENKTSPLSIIRVDTSFDQIIIKKIKSIKDLENLFNNYEEPIVLIKKYKQEKGSSKYKQNMKILESDSIYCYAHLTCDYNELIESKVFEKRMDEQYNYARSENRHDFEPSRLTPSEKRFLAGDMNPTLNSFEDNVHITLEERYNNAMSMIPNHVSAALFKLQRPELDLTIESTLYNGIEEALTNIKRYTFDFKKDINCKVGGRADNKLIDKINSFANAAVVQNNTMLEDRSAEIIAARAARAKRVTQIGNNFVEKIKSDTTAFSAYLTYKKFNLSDFNTLAEYK